MPNFAANLTMLFTEVPFMDRFALARAAGFTHVEYLFPYTFKAEDLKTELAKNGLTQVLFNLPAGDFAAGERGMAALPGRSDEFRDGVPKAIEYAKVLGVKRVIFDRCVPVFKAMAASVVRVGDVGAGNVTKLANQIIVAMNIAALSEAMVLAAKAGVEPELVYQAIRGGLAGSTVMDAKAPLMLDRKLSPGFRINLHIKDLANALDTSHEVGAPLPLTASVMEIMQALKMDDFGDSDHGAIVRYFEKQAKIEVKRSSPT
jgi:sugar phosphate isomerase/epimerase